MRADAKKPGNNVRAMQPPSARILNTYSVTLLSRLFRDTKFATYDRYSQLLRSSRNSYALHDVELFYQCLPKDANSIDAGLFVSAAVNNIIKPYDEVQFWNPDMALHYMGTKLRTGTVRIESSVANYLGHKMEGGRLIVKGDAGNFAAYEMSGGNIEVYGRVGSKSCNNMTGGRFTAHRRVGHNTGENASSKAYMLLYGGYEHLSASCKAKRHED